MTFNPEAWKVPIADDSSISFDSFEQIGLLQLKLLKYKQRRPVPKTRPNFNVPRTLGNFTTLLHYSKYTVMTIVVQLATAPNRNTLAKPIRLEEVARRFQEIADLDVSGALRVPFIYDAENDWHWPDVERTLGTAGPAAGLFIEAYNITRAYARNRLDIAKLEGGTGLPKFPGQ